MRCVWFGEEIDIAAQRTISLDNLSSQASICRGFRMTCENGGLLVRQHRYNGRLLIALVLARPCCHVDCVALLAGLVASLTCDATAHFEIRLNTRVSYKYAASILVHSPYPQMSDNESEFPSISAHRKCPGALQLGARKKPYVNSLMPAAMFALNFLSQLRYRPTWAPWETFWSHCPCFLHNQRSSEQQYTARGRACRTARGNFYARVRPQLSSAKFIHHCTRERREH